jgi:hypothetical protein
MTSYPMTRDQIGLAFIINNLDSDEKQQTQARNDVKKLEETFKKIGVKIDTPNRKNQDKKELEDFAETLATADFNAYNAVFLVIISHGIDGDLIACQVKDTYFDSKIFVEKLSENTTLVGQPKILLCDFCRGDSVNEGVEVKSISMTRIPIGSDLFVGHATTSGNVSVTRSKSSPFIEAFCEQVQLLYQSTSFLNIFQRVQQKVSEISSQVSKRDGTSCNVMQIPELKSTLRMDLFLLKAGRKLFPFFEIVLQILPYGWFFYLVGGSNWLEICSKRHFCGDTIRQKLRNLKLKKYIYFTNFFFICWPS